MKHNTCIFGLGWLGVPLAQRLLLDNFALRGTVTGQEKKDALAALGIPIIPLLFTEAGIKGSISEALLECQTAIVLIPPGLRNHSGSNFVLKMKPLVQALDAANISRCIYVSSTAVFKDTQGLVTEHTIPEPDTNRGQQIHAVETLFATRKHGVNTVIRLGGLWGANRQPVRYLAGRKDLRNGNAPVNLIHREDAVEIIYRTLLLDNPPPYLHGVAPQHPTKSAYYTAQAKKLGLPLPEFLPETPGTPYKIVKSEYLQKMEYTFKVPLS